MGCGQVAIAQTHKKLVDKIRVRTARIDRWTRFALKTHHVHGDKGMCGTRAGRAEQA